MKEEPIFLIDCEQCLDFYYSNIIEFLSSYSFKYPVILITNKEINFNNNNLYVILDKYVSSENNGVESIYLRNRNIINDIILKIENK